MKKIIALICLCFILAGCGVVSRAYIPHASPTSSEKSSSHGCLGEKLETCVQEIVSSVPLYQTSLDNALENHNKRDINGKFIDGHNLFNVAVDLLSNDRMGMITLSLSPDDRVKSVEISLPSNPLFLFNETEEEYNATGLYEAASLALGNQCPTLTKVGIYKFFQNKVKPNIRKGRREIHADGMDTDISEVSKIENVPFCGKKFSFVETTGSGTAWVTLDNTHGSFSTARVTFK